MKTVSTLFALAALAGVASAQNYVTSGELTTSDPTFNRPFTSTDLSGVGTAVAYDVYAFTVTVTGTYEAELHASGASELDTYLLVYSDFNPAQGLDNLVNGDDDYSGSLPILGGTSSSFLGSRIAASEASNLNAGGLALTAGQTYYAVAASFYNSDDENGVGTYDLGIGNGPGAVNPVPEPASMAALGLGAAAMLRRRKRA